MRKKAGDCNKCFDECWYCKSWWCFILQDTKRVDTGQQLVRYCFHGGTPESSEMQAVRSKFEELDRRNEHVVKTVAERRSGVLQRAEALVGSLRIEEVHRHLSNLESTLSHTAAILSSRADEFDQRIAGFE